MKLNKVIQLAGILLLVALLAVTLVSPVFSQHEVLGKYLPLIKGINLGLDLQGGVHVVLEAKDTPEAKVTDDSMKRLKAVIERRVDQFGVAEPVIQQQGKNRLIVELAGAIDPEEAVQSMIKTAYLEFKDESGQTVLTGADLKEASEQKDPGGTRYEVALTFTDEGARKFAELTTSHVNKNIAIYLDGEMLQNPTVNEPILSGKARITGYESLPEAHTIAVLLSSGALPVKVDIEQKRAIGPALGSDSLEKSKHAGVVGIFAILIFMLIYYRIPGLVAGFSLVIYTIIVMAIFVALNVTMTLPGIAGFLLSLGIAVDANVIIFERIREELRTGKSIRSAIDAGFKRGFTAVLDANLTTLIVAMVLYYFGEGPIKGFAVTLSVGVAASMFTAITMTRWMLHLVAGANITKDSKYYGA